MRSDRSMTLFLSDPAGYDGGELEIDTPRSRYYAIAVSKSHLNFCAGLARNHSGTHAASCSPLWGEILPFHKHPIRIKTSGVRRVVRTAVF